MKITRREFFVKSAQGAIIISLLALISPLLESCTNNVTGPQNSNALPSVNGTLSSGKIILSINSSSPLANVGSAAIVNYQSGLVLVDHPSENVYNALSSVCTHQSCTVSNFDSGKNQFVCPCHGSRFDTNGSVVQGPAGAPLRKYTTQLSGGQLIINIS